MTGYVNDGGGDSSSAIGLENFYSCCGSSVWGVGSSVWGVDRSECS